MKTQANSGLIQCDLETDMPVSWKVLLRRLVPLVIAAILWVAPSGGGAQTTLTMQGEVKFDFMRSTLGEDPARGTYLTREKVNSIEYVTVAVLVTGKGEVAPLMVELRDNDDLTALRRLQGLVKRYEHLSSPATPVATVSALERGAIANRFWYAPKERFSGDGLEVVDLGRRYGEHLRRLDRRYVLKAAGGLALASWPEEVPSGLQDPGDDALSQYVGEALRRSTGPEEAHYILSFGDEGAQLRLVYLRAAQAIPLLWGMYEAAGKRPEFGAMVREAHWIATSAPTTGWGVRAGLAALVGVALLLALWVLRHRRHLEDGRSQG